jgi:hypothetical protein
MTWTGFNNFAISFSIIAILAGCFTSFLTGLEQRRPGGDRVGLTDPVGIHPADRPVHVRTGLGLPDVRRNLLVGSHTRRA